MQTRKARLGVRPFECGLEKKKNTIMNFYSNLCLEITITDLWFSNTVDSRYLEVEGTL